MMPTSLSSGVFELIARLGSTLRLPGVASGMRLSCSYFDRSLRAPRGAPTSRAGTSASESATARPAAAVAPIPAEVVRNLLRETDSVRVGAGSLPFSWIMRHLLGPHHLVAASRIGIGAARLA